MDLKPGFFRRLGTFAVLARAGLCVCISLAAASQLAAGPFTQASAQTSGSCGAPRSQTVTGTFSASAAAQCFPVSPLQFNASASASVGFGGPITGLESLLSGAVNVNMLFPRSQFLQATSTASFTEPLVVTGGAGTGTIAYTFQTTGMGFTDVSDASSGLTVVQDGTTIGSFLACVEIVGDFPCNHMFTTAAAPFTFGKPFTFKVTLDAQANTPADGAGINDTAVLSGFTILDASGRPAPSASVQVAPEPSSFGLAACSLLLLGFRRWRGEKGRASCRLSTGQTTIR